MIKYSLKCLDCSKKFDSWFSSSSEFDRLKKLKFLNCEMCGSMKIEKSLMSPNLSNTKKRQIIDNDTNYKEVKKKLKDYQKFIKKNFEFVGDNFAGKVRDVYYNKEKNKAIYGTATPEERKELADEGIDLLSIPWVSKDN